jgi:hypothetical protein
MKIQKYIAMGLLFSSFPSFAEFIPVNSYECKGNAITVSYSTTSFIGKPQAKFIISKQPISGTGEEVTVQQTVLGNLVTLTKKTIPDLYTDTITVLLPDINVAKLGAKVTFNAQLISSRARTSIAGTQLVNGVIQKNIVYPINCTATAVVF